MSAPPVTAARLFPLVALAGAGTALSFAPVDPRRHRDDGCGAIDLIADPGNSSRPSIVT
jgi:hypothetical protein